MPLYNVRVKVSPDRTPAYNFPVDMLRRDRLYPASEDQVGVLHAAISDPLSLPENAVIDLAGLRTTKHPDLTEDRWISFGWKVVKVEVNKAY